MVGLSVLGIYTSGGEIGLPRSRSESGGDLEHCSGDPSVEAWC